MRQVGYCYARSFSGHVVHFVSLEDAVRSTRKILETISPKFWASLEVHLTDPESNSFDKVIDRWNAYAPALRVEIERIPLHRDG